MQLHRNRVGHPRVKKTVRAGALGGLVHQVGEAALSAIGGTGVNSASPGCAVQRRIGGRQQLISLVEVAISNGFGRWCGERDSDRGA